MTSSTPHTPAGGWDREANVADYRSVCGRAVIGLILGLLSPLALIGPVLWVVPALGALVSLLALRAIGRESDRLLGRKAAVAGLALSLMFGAAAPMRMLSHGWWLAREARPFARLWFDLLENDEPHKAHQLTIASRSRQPLDADLWSFYRNADDARESLENFVDAPLPRALLALGDDARVRYWGTEATLPYEGADHISQIYAITWGEGADRTTFFARVAMERSTHSETGAPRWRILSYQGGVTPFEPDE